MDEKKITRSYDAKYDLVKFVLSLLVIAIHASVFPEFTYPWLRIAVPLFFMISSYFLFSKIHRSPLESHKGILENFAVRNLQLYFTWLIILLPVTMTIRKKAWTGGTDVDNIIAFLKSLLFGSTFKASWYLMATVLGVLLIYGLSRLLRKDVFVFIIALGAFVLVTLASSYSYLIKGTFVEVITKTYQQWFGTAMYWSFPASLFWIFIGKMMAEGKLRLNSLWLIVPLILISGVGLYFEWSLFYEARGKLDNDSFFMLAPFCISLFLGVQKIGSIPWKHSVYFRRASTVIYVSHCALLRIVNKVLSTRFDVKDALLSFVVTLVCSLLVYLCIELLLWLAKKCRLPLIEQTLKTLY